MLPVVLAALLVAPNGWGPSGCAAVAVPSFPPASFPVFSPVIHLPPAPVVTPAPPQETFDQALERVLARRAARKAKGCACDPCECPEPCPCAQRARPPVGDLPTGVDWPRIGSGYSHKGRCCSRAEAVAAVLADDSAKPFLVIVGDEATRKRVLADLEQSPLVTPSRAFVRVQAYDPGHWVPAARGYKPGLHLVKADGSRLAAPVSAYDGPEALAKLLKRADPNAPPEPVPPPGGKRPCWALWACAALLLYILLFTRRDK